MPRLSRDEDYAVDYKCRCGATDTNKYFAHEQPLPVINCWKCKAGFKVNTYAEMIQTQQGIVPVKEYSDARKR